MAVHVQGRRSAAVTRLPYKEAREAVQRLGISTIAQYRQRYREVPGLPSNPPEAYAAAWVNWPAFLAPHEAKFLPLADAMTAVKPLAIQDQHDYRQRYRECPGLPSNPQKSYSDWPGWSVFLRKSDVRQIRRKSLDLAASQGRVRELGLTTRQAYMHVADTEPGLTRTPERLTGWPGWSAFLGVADADPTWLTYSAARAAVQTQGWTAARTYRNRYRDHVGLPQSLDRVYAEWTDWAAFLAPKRPEFLSYVEASRVVHAAGIHSFETMPPSTARTLACPALRTRPMPLNGRGGRPSLRGYVHPQAEHVSS